MSTGSVGDVGPHDEEGGAELAERDREGEPGRDERGAGDDRQVDLAPHPRRRRAEHRRRLAQPRVDGPQHRAS